VNDGPQLRLQPDASRLTWPAFLEDVVSRHGGRCCIRFEGRDISSKDIQRDARRLAKALAASGVAKGMRIAVHMANRPEFAVASFAVAMLGAVLVPVNTYATPAEREYILRHGDCALLLFQCRLLKHDFLDELLQMFPALQRSDAGVLCNPKAPFLRQVVALGLEQSQGGVQAWETFLQHGDQFPDTVLDAMIAEVVPCDESLIIYTSGTTARPKGVLHLQRAAVIQSWRFAEDLCYGTDDRVWTTYPFFWSAGICMALGACMAAGSTLVLQETFEPGAALQCLVDERVNATQSWPHQAKAMAEHPLYQQLELSRIDKEVNRMQPDIDPAQDAWGTQGSFGMTETFTLASNLPADAPATLRNATAGIPLPGMRVRIVNPDTGSELRTGEQGEIAVKGLTLMRGYYKVAPEATFDADGYFHSQDGGYLDEHGYLHWQGRLSNIIKTGGANVSPLEIEECLLGYPDMRAAVAFGAPHPSLGEVIVLCAVAIEGETLEPERIVDFLKQRLAAYKIPRKILLFAESDLNFTGTQKIQTGKLIERALARLRVERAVIEGINYGSYLEDAAS
jgi:acyl-CoA synthetase (AMP-forming)/AMP-acid ligase II